MKDLSNNSILVLGLGGSGDAAARLALACGAHVTAIDGGDTAALQAKAAELRLAGAEVRLKWRPGQESGHVDFIVSSPGIPLGSPMSDYADSLGCPVISELQFGAEACTGKKLAVTGTNGKTTTVEMLSHCLNALGIPTLAGGNIGRPLSEIALTDEREKCQVVEVSSFQMERSQGFQPFAAALLNISPDHLVRHHTMEAYLDLKLSLLKHADSRNPVVVNTNLLSNEQVKTALKDRLTLTFSATDPTADFCVQNNCLVRRNGQSMQCLVLLDMLSFKGNHNYENALAALAMVEAAGQSITNAALALTSFQVGPHRLQCVCQKHGIRFIDDSKATNVDALIKSLESFANDGLDIALLAGGLDKGCDLDGAIPALKPHVKHAFLFGTCQHKLAAIWGNTVPCTVCDTLDKAFSQAVGSLGNKPGIVLLAPGCASQDQFKDYIQRGDLFAKLANAIADEVE